VAAIAWGSLAGRTWKSTFWPTRFTWLRVRLQGSTLQQLGANMNDVDRQVDLGFTPDRYPEGVHLCGLFSDEQERGSVVYPFVRAGLRDGEKVDYLADAAVPDWRERAVDERTMTSLPPNQLKMLSVVSAEETYCPTGEFIPQVMLDHLRDVYEQSRSIGSEGSRVTGETSWLARKPRGAGRFVEYESALNTFIRESPMTILCQYDTEKFDGETLFKILGVHPIMIVRGQIMHNPYYLSPEELQDPSDLERPIDPVAQQHTVLGRLLVVQQTLASLPDETHIAQFSREAFLRVPGVRDVHVCFRSGVVPADDRFEEVRQRCTEAWADPASLDLSAIEHETGARCLAVRTPSHLFGVYLVEVGDKALFAPYLDFFANITNAVAVVLDQRLSLAQMRLGRERIASLEQHLRRIAGELEGSGVVSAFGRIPDPTELPGIGELSGRQWEVLTRLLRGERVPGIAKALFVSQSTVRNHLAEIYRKLGVHSQEELLELLRADQRA
jgi:DNA-binding CsgD family transcriptional regulator